MRPTMGAAIALTIALAAPAADDRVEVRVPVSESGAVDLGEVVARLAGQTGVAIPGPVSTPSLPVRGLAGALTRTLLNETLGPDVTLEVGPRDLVISIDRRAFTFGRSAEWGARLRDLAQRAAREGDRRTRHGMRGLASYRPNDPGRPTVCLLHGLNSSSGSFVHIIPLLEGAGYGVVVYDFPFNRDLDASCPAFVRDWKAFRARAGEGRPWAILSHSMGALLARWYVEGPEYAGDVSALLLIAPPNRGSAVAGAQTLMQLIRNAQSVRGRDTRALTQLSEGLGEAAEDLGSGSRFLAALNARPRRPGVGYHILAGDAGFLAADARRRIEAQLRSIGRAGGLLGGISRIAASDLAGRLDELSDGTGDGCVSVASTRLEGVADHAVIHANHVELIRGPLLFPDPGPVASWPWIAERLGRRARR